VFRKSIILSLMVFVLAIAAACSSDPTNTAPAPTDTSTPPTATSVPPTLAPGETPQPTATAVPPTPTRTAVPRPPTPTTIPTPEKPYWEGRTVTFISSFSPGGGHDFTTRLLARYMPQYLPGNPQAIVQTRTGAGGIVSMNYLVNSSKPDGMAVLDVTGNIINSQLVDAPGVQFDLAKVKILGLVSGGPYSCSVWHESGVSTMQEIIDSPTPIFFGSSPPTGWAINILKDYMGGNITSVDGYSGSTAQAAVALEQGEIDGWCTLWQGWTGARPDWVAEGKIIPVIQTTDNAAGDALLADLNVPTLLDFRDTMTEVQFNTAVAANAGNDIQLHFSIHPDTPPEIVAQLREAFWKSVTNPEFVADSLRTNRPVHPLPGDQVQAKMIQILENATPEVIAGLKDLLGG